MEFVYILRVSAGTVKIGRTSGKERFRELNKDKYFKIYPVVDTFILLSRMRRKFLENMYIDHKNGYFTGGDIWKARKIFYSSFYQYGRVRHGSEEIILTRKLNEIMRAIDNLQKERQNIEAQFFHE